MSKTYKVKPINKISDIPKGTFDWVCSFITDTTVPLKELTEEKEITLLELHETIKSNELEGWIAKQGNPIEQNYLLGLAVQYPEAFETGKDYISTASVFSDEDGDRCFFSVLRRDVRRELDLVLVDDDWHADDDWVFLAEPLKSSPETLSPLDTETLEKAIGICVMNGYTVTKTK